jgi:hypothetical protein
MLRAAFTMAALVAGVPPRDVQIAARHSDPRTTTVSDRRRANFDHHAAYVVVGERAAGLGPAGSGHEPDRVVVDDAFVVGPADRSVG